MICLPAYDDKAIGGGWSFLANFKTILGDYVTDYDKADTYFIPSASMVSRDEVMKAKDDGKKIVLRCDNIIRNSRNRNTGMSRMKDFAKVADLVIYQSEFARGLLDHYLKPSKSVVILNSCNEKLFTKTLHTTKLAGVTRYLYARSSTDETKNWEMARLQFQYAENPKQLTIVGKGFDSNMIEYNFDFYQNEDVRFIGEVTDRSTMATIYRNHDYLLYSFFNDACSNTLIEALCCGLTIVDCSGMAKTGGAPEILDKYRKYGQEYFFLERMGKEYLSALEAT